MAVLGLSCLRWSTAAAGVQPGQDSLLVALGKVLTAHHYHPASINDAFSEQVWRTFLHTLDPSDNVFCQEDIDQLRPFAHRLDDELEGRQTFAFLPAVTALYQHRLAAALEADSALALQPFQYHVHDQVRADGGTGQGYAATEKGWRERRAMALKYLALQYRSALQKGALADSSDAVQEAASRQKAIADISARYHKLLALTNTAELFEILVGAICHQMDPHTDYFPPAVATAPSAMGAVADRMKSNMLLGTALIHRNGHLYGYIVLPAFYLDTVRGFRCAEDMAKALASMDSSHVEGLIIDLRNNSGGSLLEVQAMVGMLVKGEAVVQLKGKDMEPALLKSTTAQPIYNGPLAVLVNSQTASAAELFTAAMQDYGRAVICGSPTFGKGTVQRPFPVGNAQGYVKVTFEQLFRVNGSSTQLRGVTPDLLLPDIYQFGRAREATKPQVLPWDSIPPAHITRWAGAPQVARLKATYAHRVMDDTLYATITQKNNWLAAHDTAVAPLEVAAYLQFAAARQQTIVALNQLLKLPAARQDQASPASFSFMEDAAAYQRWLHLVQADLFVHATTGVLEAWVSGS